MSAAALPESIVSFGADNTFANVSIGDVASGDVIKTYNTIVNPAAPPTIERHADVPSAPRPLRTFRDRDAEQAQLRAELRPRGGAWLSGDDGCGVTALLRTVANLPTTEALPDGVAFVDGTTFPAARDDAGLPRPLALDDVTQQLFELFYHSSDPLQRIHMPLAQATPYLRRLQALFLLDRLPLNQPDLLRLADTLAQGTVLIGGEGPAPDTLLAVPVQGLPRADALAFLSSNAGIDPSPPETAAQLERVVIALDGLPLPLLLLAQLLRTGTVALPQLVAVLEQLGTKRDALTRAVRLVLSGLGDTERAALAALVGAGGPDLSLEALAAISEIPAPQLQLALARLVDLRLLTSNAERYMLASVSLHPILARLLQPTAERKRAAAFFAGAAALHPGDLAWLGRELGNLLSAAQSALAQGQMAQVGILSQAMQPVLVLRGWWEAWGATTNWAVQAAQATGNQALLAWALHERGTRAGLLQSGAAAAPDLREALRLRNALNDAAGAAATQHNMTYFGLLKPLVPRRPWVQIAVAALVVLVIGAGLIVPPLLSSMNGTTTPTSVALLPSATATLLPLQPSTTTTPSALPSATASATRSPTTTASATRSPTPSPLPATATPTFTPVPLRVLADEQLRDGLEQFNQRYTDEFANVSLGLEFASNNGLIQIVAQTQADVLISSADAMQIALNVNIVNRDDIQALACATTPPSSIRQRISYFIAPSNTTAQRDQAIQYIAALLRQICATGSTPTTRTLRVLVDESAAKNLDTLSVTFAEAFPNLLQLEARPTRELIELLRSQVSFDVLVGNVDVMGVASAEDFIDSNAVILLSDAGQPQCYAAPTKAASDTQLAQEFLSYLIEQIQRSDALLNC